MLYLLFPFFHLLLLKTLIGGSRKSVCLLQIKVYDAAEKTRTLVELPGGKAIPTEEGS